MPLDDSALPPELFDLPAFSGDQKPGWCLAAPEGALRVRPHIPTGPLQAGPDRLLAAMARCVRAQPRSRILAADTTLYRIDAIQRTRVCRFTDDVSLWAMPVPMPDGRIAAAPVILSRSRIGRWDMGTNRRRVECWLATMLGFCSG
ncbi:DUF1499 domain-containing protein [Tistrella mobilis]|jgi:uncharacterized protein (DUF1499 family)|uniref:DUF1499 domain-containing protein n=1 Tax=Tistrella mobilis TaxID=171437 RepID=UPI003557F346